MADVQKANAAIKANNVSNADYNMPNSQLNQIHSPAHRFDNRLSFLAYHQKLNRRSGMHFSFTAGGKKIVYCYIRKNACSAFKRLIVGTSDKAEKPSFKNNTIGFLSLHYKSRYPRDFWAADHTVFVYRDPLERIISVFKNKFIQRSGAKDMFDSYTRITGLDPENASFHDFVLTYLRPKFAGLDSHVLPQRYHLQPALYSDAIPMTGLYTAMIGIVGQELADEHFKTPRNSSQDNNTYSDIGIEQLPSRILHERYANNKEMPTSQSFMTDEITQRIAQLYKTDASFYSR